MDRGVPGRRLFGGCRRRRGGAPIAPLSASDRAEWHDRHRREAGLPQAAAVRGRASFVLDRPAVTGRLGALAAAFREHRTQGVSSVLAIRRRRIGAPSSKARAGSSPGCVVCNRGPRPGTAFRDRCRRDRRSCRRRAIAAPAPRGRRRRSRLRRDQAEQVEPVDVGLVSPGGSARRATSCGEPTTEGRAGAGAAQSGEVADMDRPVAPHREILDHRLDGVALDIFDRLVGPVGREVDAGPARQQGELAGLIDMPCVVLEQIIRPPTASAPRSRSRRQTGGCRRDRGHRSWPLLESRGQRVRGLAWSDR